MRGPDCYAGFVMHQPVFHARGVSARACITNPDRSGRIQDHPVRHDRAFNMPGGIRTDRRGFAHKIRAELRALLAQLPGRSPRHWLDSEIQSAKDNPDRDVEALQMLRSALER